MATPKTKPAYKLPSIDESYPVVGHRWSVVDYYPAYETCNEYDYAPDVHSARSVAASPYFDTESEADEWKERHDPEPGATLRVLHEKLRQYNSTKWSNF